MRSTIVICSLLTVGLCVLACGTSTTLKGTWTDPEYRRGEIGSVLVLAVLPDEGLVRPFEVQLKSELSRYGVRATATSDELPRGQKLDENTFDEYFRDKGIDAVLVARFIDANTYQQYNPGSTYVRPGFYHDFYGYYHHSYEVVHTPGYTSTHTTIRVESNLYETRDEHKGGSDKMVWTAASDTYDPDSAYDAMDSIARVVVAELVSQGFFKKAQ